MSNLFLQALYLMLPAYFANMAPVVTKNIFNWLAKPIDRNKTFLGKPIFGSHKTWRGFIFAIIFAIVIAFIQSLLQKYPSFRGISLAVYNSWLAIGFFIGFGAIAGDLAKSFFKRRLNISPGKPFVPWDQTDFIIGALLCSFPFFRLSFQLILAIIAISFFGHILINHTAYYLGIRNEKW